MIEGIHFSRQGGPLTDFERQLLEQSKSESPWVVVAQRLMVQLGTPAGCRAFAILLDELGPGRLNIPTRDQFFRVLWQGDRDALIVDLAARADWTYADIGRTLGVSREYVRRIVGRQPKGPTKGGRP